MIKTTLSIKTDSSWQNLLKYLEKTQKAAIACSGGVDSTLLLYVAASVPGLEVTAYTVKSLFIPDEDVIEAEEYASNLGINHVILNLDINKTPSISENSPLRCYNCKKAVFTAISESAASSDIFSVMEGSHHDDLSDYRPGLKALEELNIKSPLKEAGFTKKTIRELAEHLGIKSWNRPSSPCLATRIPYGTIITEELIGIIHRSEKFLKEEGFKQIRVRAHNNIARIETGEDEIEKLLDKRTRLKIESALKKFGFNYITLDLGGYRSGSMNIGIEHPENTIG